MANGNNTSQELRALIACKDFDLRDGVRLACALMADMSDRINSLPSGAEWEAHKNQDIRILFAAVASLLVAACAGFGMLIQAAPVILAMLK